MFYVYVLIGADGKHYVGYTADLRRRLAEHNQGANPSTCHQQWSLLYYEAYRTEHKARDRERKLKHHGKVYQLLMDRLSE